MALDIQNDLFTIQGFELLSPEEETIFFEETEFKFPKND
jgi:hypothetical protein